jgi:hypothetical protein
MNTQSIDITLHILGFKSIFRIPWKVTWIIPDCHFTGTNAQPYSAFTRLENCLAECKKLLNGIFKRDIWGPHVDEFEYCCILGCDTV